jgi:hypothetical protein
VVVDQLGGLRGDNIMVDSLVGDEQLVEEDGWRRVQR